MPYENLLKSVEESAEEKERELREGAQKQADAIRSEAKKLAEEIQVRTVQEAENAAQIERNKQVPRERQDQGAGSPEPGEDVRGRL